MTEGHYCSIHGVTFFKKGKMRGYAHPIVGEDGKDTGEWCNEEDLEKVKALPPQTPEVLTEHAEVIEQARAATRKPNTNDSIESQVAFKGMIELISSDKLPINSPTGKATMAWAITRLGGKVEKADKQTTGQVSSQDDTGQKSEGEAVVTPGDLFNWIMKHDKNIKVPRVWVETNFGLPENEVLTNEKAQELHKKMKENMGWA